MIPKRRKIPREEFDRKVAECRDPSCTQVNGRCVGWHCVYCGERCSMMGHGAADCKGWVPHGQVKG